MIAGFKVAVEGSNSDHRGAEGAERRTPYEAPGRRFPQSGLVLKSRENEISVHRRFRGELSNEHSGAREARGGCAA